MVKRLVMPKEKLRRKDFAREILMERSLVTRKLMEIAREKPRGIQKDLR